MNLLFILMFVCLQHSHKLIIPQMASLISSCWSRDPSSRPSAAQICELLGAMAYCNLDKIIHLPNDGIVGKCCAFHWAQPIEVSSWIVVSTITLVVN